MILTNKKAQNKHIQEKCFVFHDHSGMRWKKIRLLLAFLFIVIVLLVTEFSLSLQVSPFLPKRGIQTNSFLPIDKPLFNHENVASTTISDPIQQPNADSAFAKDPVAVYGYYEINNYNSRASLERYMESINTLIPACYHLVDDGSFETSNEQDLELLARNKGVKIMPSISNIYESAINSQALFQMLDSQEKRTKLIAELLDQIKAGKYSGINVNLQGIDVEHKEPFNIFMADLYKAFHTEGLAVTIIVPATSGSYDYANLSNNADMVLLMLYMNRFEAPGPIAPLAWSQEIINSTPIPRGKLTVMFSNYSYDRTNDTTSLNNVCSYWDAIEIANKSKSQIFWDPESLNPYFRYLEGNKEHTVWFLDGVTFYNQLKFSLEAGVRGVALQLGTEDPTVWQIISNLHNKPQEIMDNILSIDCLDSLMYKGQGEIMNFISVSQAGKRSFQLTKEGFLTDEKYTSYPIPNVIERSGNSKAKVVALTFDDGPDSIYTPEILDVLKQQGVKATFFEIGENIALHPDITKKVYMGGHEIGSHTLTHCDLGKINPSMLRLEMNSTQRLIQQITGHSTVLFRPPYITDFEVSREEMQSLYYVQQMGYTTVGTFIDSIDWNEDNYTNITKNVKDNLHLGNVILFHDGGGDRSRTVKALPEIIQMLKNEGYTFITLKELAGKTQEEVMPPIQQSEVWYTYSMETIRSIVVFTLGSINGFILLAIVLGALRLVLFIYLSFRQRNKSIACSKMPNYSPFISVVVAAFNEETVICKTIHGILESNYPDFEVIIVDDGSTDNTAAIVKQTFISEKRVRLISKRNGGKSSAMNLGFRESEGEIIIALDADTVIVHNALSLMVRHFANKNIAAVSGNVKVGNVCNLLTRWQYLEYVTGFNLEKRCFDQLNCITVVPGAIGAWRKEAVKRAGYYKDDTQAEDTDLTLTLLEQGYQVTLEDKAIAFTEAPQDLKSFVKQRRRWAYGTLQCLWKHRRTMLNCKRKSLNFIAIPNIILFQYIFQALSPLADMLFVAGLFRDPKRMIAYYLLFLIIDLVATLYAFSLEKEKKGLLVWVVLQRVVYRWYMTYIIWISVITACKGVRIGWNKLVRIGNVKNAA